MCERVKRGRRREAGEEEERRGYSDREREERREEVLGVPTHVLRFKRLASHNVHAALQKS